MLPSENRLRRRQDFATALRRGRRAGRPLLVVHLHRGTAGGMPPGGGSGARVAGRHDPSPHVAGEAPSPPARAGFVVSRAVGPAVVRNRVKRRLRHLLRDRMSLLPAGSLVVVRALPRAGAADFADLERDLDAALGRLLRAQPTPTAPTGAGR